MRKIVCAAVLLASPAHAEGETSAYTTLDFEAHCTALSTYEAGGTFACQGYKGFPFILSHGDLRESVFFGHLGQWFNAPDGGQAFASFGAFNGIGKTVEWRLAADGVPFAAILRWTIDRPDGGDAKDSVLVVSKVGLPGEGEACPVGYVDAVATPDANVVARDVADRLARGFACRTAEAGWHGVIRDDKPDVMVHFPEGG